jgi:hypothetical protein
MSDQETKFFNRKGTLEQMENYNIIIIFGSKENPSFLPCHIMNKMFVTDITRQYNYWLHFSTRREKSSSFLYLGKLGTSCLGTPTRLTNSKAISTT